MGLDKQDLGAASRASPPRSARRESAMPTSPTRFMYLVKFFEDVLGYDSLKGEISKELAIKDRYCDIALKVRVRCGSSSSAKAAGLKALADKHIEQAENYGSPFGRAVGPAHQRHRLRALTTCPSTRARASRTTSCFEANLLDGVEKDPEALWVKLSILARGRHEAGRTGRLLGAAEGALGCLGREGALPRGRPARGPAPAAERTPRRCWRSRTFQGRARRPLAGGARGGRRPWYHKRRKKRRKVQTTDVATGADGDGGGRGGRRRAGGRGSSRWRRSRRVGSRR